LTSLGSCSECSCIFGTIVIEEIQSILAATFSLHWLSSSVHVESAQQIQKISCLSRWFFAWFRRLTSVTSGKVEVKFITCRLFDLLFSSYISKIEIIYIVRISFRPIVKPFTSKIEIITSGSRRLLSLSNDVPSSCSLSCCQSVSLFSLSSLFGFFNSSLQISFFITGSGFPCLCFALSLFFISISASAAISIPRITCIVCFKVSILQL
jgi:hypothetical protein